MNQFKRNMPLHSGVPALLLLVAALTWGCPGPEVKEDPLPKETPKTMAPTTLEPVPEELIAKSGVEEFEVDGLKVLLKYTKGKPIVSVDLLIDGGLTNATPNTIGLEALALTTAANGGTRPTPRDDFNAKLDSMGSSISASAGRGYSSVSMSCVRPYFGETWALFGEVLTQPAFDNKQLEINRKRTVESIKAAKDSADDYVGILANEVFYGDHPYAWQTIGKVSNVEGFTGAQLAEYYRKLLNKKRLTLVVVGDISRVDLERGIKKDLVGLAAEGDPVGKIEAPAPGGADVKFYENEKLPTNYLFGFFGAPAPDHPDYYPMLVATTILRDRLFEEVRTKRNLTYAVSAGISGRRFNIGYLYVTAVKPNEAVKVMYDEVRKLGEEPISDKELKDLIAGFLTRHYMGLETNSAQAGQLASAELLSDGWERTLVLIDTLGRVKPDDVMRVVKKYINGVHWGYVGKKASADEALLKSL